MREPQTIDAEFNVTDPVEAQQARIDALARKLSLGASYAIAAVILLLLHAWARPHIMHWLDRVWP